MKYNLLLFLFACEEITIKNEPILMAELEVVEKLFENEGLKWNPNNLTFRLVFDESLEVWGTITQTNTYFKISINPESPDYLITILSEVGHLNGLEHGDGIIMTYGILSITSAVWPWNKDEYLNEYFNLIK